MATIDISIPQHIIEDALVKAIEALKAKHRELGMRATGEWEDSLEAQADHNRGRIIGMHYTEQLVQGRAPGRIPPVDPLERWVQAKLGKSGKEARSIAFAVARKIGQGGTTWYQQGGSDLVEVLEDPQVSGTFYDEIAQYLRVQVSGLLLREFKELES